MTGKAKADHGESVKAGGVSMKAGQDVLADKIAVIGVSLTAGGLSGKADVCPGRPIVCR